MVLGIIWGIQQRYKLPATPLLTPDSWGYLHPALSWIGGTGFEQTDGRGWFYPAILALIIKATGNFSCIVRYQQFLGLAAAPVLWLTVRMWLSLYPARSRLCHSVTVYFGALASWIYQSNTTQIWFELTIQPEAVLAFFVMAYLVCALAYVRARWFAYQHGMAIFFGVASLVLSYCVLLLKPSWGFAIIPSGILLVVGAFGPASRVCRFAPVLIGTVVTSGLAIMPNLLGFKGDLRSRTFLPFTLVSIHAAQIVRNAAKHDLLNQVQSGDSPELRFYQELAQAWDVARKTPLQCRTLGFAPDDIMYTNDFFGKFQAEQHLTDMELLHLCYSVYLRTWVEAPGSMLAKIGKEISVFISAPSTDFSAHSFHRGRALEMATRFSPSPQSLLNEATSRKYLESQPAYLSYLQDLERVYQRGWQINCLNWLRCIAVVVAKLSSFIQLAFFGALIMTLLRKGLSYLRLPGLAVLIVIGAVYGNMLTVAVVHSLDLDRYRTGYTPALMVALVIMTAFLIGFVEHMWRERWSSTPEDAPESALQARRAPQ
jgi:hypothetical protein